MKLMDIYKSTLKTPHGIKKGALSLKNPNVPDNYERNTKLNASLIKDDENELRYLKISLKENNLLLPEQFKKIEYDTIMGFYKVSIDFELNRRDSVDKIKYTPDEPFAHFIFDLTKEVDRVRRKYFTELCERKGIMYTLSDGLDGYDKDDFKNLTDKNIRIQGMHEIISIIRHSFAITKTSNI